MEIPGRPAARAKETSLQSEFTAPALSAGGRVTAAGGRRTGQRRSSDRRLTGSGFGPRLLASLLLTLAGMSAIHYGLSSRDIQASLVAESLRDHAADADLIEESFKDPGRGETSLGEVGEVIDAIANRPGVVEVVLVNRQGSVIAANEDRDLGEFEATPNVTQVIDTGEPYGGPQQDAAVAGASPFEYIVPVQLSGEELALDVHQTDLLLGPQREHLRIRVATTTLFGLLLGIPLFYATGGRSLSKRHKEAVAESERDPLTQLGNHRAFQEEIRRACRLAESSGEPLSLVLVDVDDFKQTNDRFGHQYGDDVLVGVARALRSRRSSDRAYRLGGDEYAILLPHTEVSGALLAANRARATVARTNPEITLSAGVAQFEPGTSDDTLNERSDAALYEAKRRGRNIAVSFGDMDDPAIVSPAKVRAVRTLLQEGNIGVVFQPIWDLGAGRILGFEALARPS
ncbi:MAG: diguanylate cyclase, partial [Actinomycetota bacterium]|nr:diguanylate cyclase [Actinomycetota bacterium]